MTRITNPTTVSVAEAAKLLGIGRTLGYELARWRGELAPGVPVIKVGERRYRVPIRPLAQALGLEVGEIVALVRAENTIVCRFCGAPVELIEALVDGELWWRCPNCAALLERKVGGAK